LKMNKDKNGLNNLIVFDRLEIGPVKLERNRLTAPYTIHNGDKQTTSDLIYKYEQDVFDPDDPSDKNLGVMIAAQAALNYGLFFREIVFSGNFDSQDRRFITDMIENTSREIYVNKILKDNPFITGNLQNFPVYHAKRYTRASLIFKNPEEKRPRVPWKFWQVDNNRHAILSSGGKDSLLTYGLLHEIGKEVYPVFINESGRHWFTALNAYRYFSTNVPNTSRVWTNADRLFNRMLKQFPFIRKDYNRLRADIYPIRLWTVAVFLFGALPIMKKSGIGRLLIGDEYDTSIRSAYEGITNYEGLYDQSIYFDKALSRYFLAKGWAVSQFSIVRHLSELLIEKILVERYPKLQKQQLSCHAAHKEGGRIKPCGQCEKCRRIIGMLSALNADPKRCGYDNRQIENSLNNLVLKGVHQEHEGAEQMLRMLDQNKKIIIPDKIRKKLKERSEILAIRFENEKAPVNCIPTDLRRPLFKIWLEHSSGTVIKSGRKWKAYNPFSENDLNIPYNFETLAVSKTKTSKDESRNRKNYILGELTWPEAEEYIQQVDVALLPVGSIEQHGPHLPLDTDAFDADYLAKQVAEACSHPKPLVLPLIPYGVSYHHDDFPGTLSINNDTLSKLVYEIGLSAAKTGIKKLVIINGHGGNSPSLNFAAQMINRDSKIFSCVDSGETSDVDIYELVETPNDVHAGEFETSTTLAVRPHLVKMDKAKKMIPSFSSRYLNFTSKRGISWYAYTKKISKNGTMGDPTKASREKGEKMWQIMIAHLVAFIEDLKQLSPDQIYERRY
jgi:creatinine amidohydrolase/Fe(II)-dependent formamide hydrolase-like protein